MVNANRKMQLTNHTILHLQGGKIKRLANFCFGCWYRRLCVQPNYLAF